MDNLSFAILQVFLEHSSLSLIQLGAILNVDPIVLLDVIGYLRKKDFLQIEPTYAMSKKSSATDSISLKTPLVITFNGKIALESETKQRSHFYFTELRAWITLAIAIAAFILSIFSLYLQYR